MAKILMLAASLLEGVVGMAPGSAKRCAQLDEARRQLFEAAFSRVVAAGQAVALTLMTLLGREAP